jgi:chloramphenicol-sensitive protein RarD
VTGVGDERRGLPYGLAAYLIWGLFPLYFPLLEPAGTVEILAQRMAWSLVVSVLILAFGGGFAGVRAVVAERRTFGYLALAAVLITVNWGTYIYAVNAGHVVEASLGYFINPLFTILLGVLVLGERLRPGQWVAVGVGGLAVAVIAIDYGRPPWIALVLAASFGLYGFLKKKASVGAADSMAIETGVLFVPAVAVIAVIGARGDLVFGTRLPTSVLLAGSGIVTIIPLLLFAGAARRLPLSVLGLVQFLTPVLQFAVGVGIRHEKLPTTEWVGFVLVWAALILLSVEGLRSNRRAAALERAAEAVTAA